MQVPIVLQLTIDCLSLLSISRKCIYIYICISNISIIYMYISSTSCVDVLSIIYAYI